jgi:hypothetical protein
MCIRAVVAVFCLLILVGCGGNNSPNPPDPPNPPTPPSPSLKIVAPPDGVIVKGAPVTVSVSAANVPDPANVLVWLNGSDITAKLGAANANGVSSANVGLPDVNYGKNQIQVRYNGLKVNSSFIFDAASGTGTGKGLTQVSSTNLAVPVKTRVLRNGDPNIPTNWGIQVGDITYWSNVPILSDKTPCPDCNQGFQVLFLNRQDLSLVSNISYIVSSPYDIYSYSPFIIALQNAAQGVLNGCEHGGCIMVMQSLTLIGYAPCYNQSNVSRDCAGYSPDAQREADYLSQLGASDIVLYANDGSAHTAYSFIGNAAGGKNKNSIGGTQYERLGCSDTTFGGNPTICDSLGAFSSSLNSPPDPTQTGAISGMLIRDNYNSFTYSPNAPELNYTFGTGTVNGALTNVVSIDGSTTEGEGQYSMSLPKGSRGGFRLLILDRNNPGGTSCLSCSTGAKRFDQFYDIDRGLASLENEITNNGQGSDGNSLMFLASMGNISHDDGAGSASNWDAFVKAVNQIGGNILTLQILGDVHQAFNADGKDDYLLVGRPVPNVYTNSMPPFHGEESGYVIRRRTVSNATSPTSVEGVLALDHEGYYAPRLQGANNGMAIPQVTFLASASLLPPTAWPAVSTAGQQNAYSWISTALCCADIRAGYINRNASPEVWLTQLEQLQYPSSESGNFSPADFSDVQEQLATEFNYVSLVRNLQNNILSLYQSQQSNVALILQQAEGDVQADIFAGAANPPQVSPSPWRAFTTDVFPVMGDLAGFIPEGGNAIKTALGVGTLVINSAVDRTNDASGNSQFMLSLAKQDLAVADLAQHAVDEYTDSLVTLGNDFNRIVSDWGRLRALGGPLANGQLQWDNTAGGYFLRAFNLAARRQYYPALMTANTSFFVTHIQYGDYQYNGSDDRYEYGNNEGCPQSNFHVAQDNNYANSPDLKSTAWYPGQIQSGNANGSTQGAYWWDIWALGLSPDTNDNCPVTSSGQLPSTYGMFDPIDQNNPSGLGLWKPDFFTQWSGTTFVHQNGYFSNVP